MILRITLLLLLSCASLPLLASEGRMESPDGEGCPSVTGVDERERASGGQGSATEAVSKDKTAPAERGGNAENGVRTPRMHNLLPGMFR